MRRYLVNLGKISKRRPEVQDVFAGYFEIIPNSDPPVENRKMTIDD